MEQLFRVRHNAMNIATINSFAQIKCGMNNGCKDVYFVAALGTDTTYVNDIVEMDKTLGIQMLNGNGFYKRMMSLPAMMNEEHINYYAKCYDEWIKSEKKKMSIKMKSCESQEFQEVLASVCVSGEQLYRQNAQHVSDSMVKNFMVKILYWLDSVFEEETYQWDWKGNSKIVVSNVTKKQELLFWYLVTLLGNDVLMLQAERDIENGVIAENAIHKISLGNFSAVKIPEYEKITKKEEQKPVTYRNSSDSPNIKMTIPKRENRHNDTKNNSAASPRREKSYEELAQLASSVVLIAIHDANGEVIGSGSGIMIGTNGYILTNNHVASGGRYYSVRIEDDDKTYATEEVIKYNSVLDLAVIRIQRKLNALPIYKGTEKLVRGQKVVAIGSPLGLFNSVSDGIISGFRTIDLVEMIQFTAPISHGSSGGAVLNMYGEVIGISTAGIDAGQNINLAVGYENINSFIKGFV